MKKKKTKKVSEFVNKPLDFMLILITLILLALGLIMVLSASSPSSLSSTRKQLYICKETDCCSCNWNSSDAIFIEGRL